MRIASSPMSIMAVTRAACAALALTFLGAGSLWATPLLYGTTGTGGSGSTLVQLDPTTGALVQTIGSVGYTVNGLVWDASSGVMYGSTGVFDAYNGLITIDLTTGLGTPIGVSGWGLGTTAAVTNIAISPLDGQMYGWWDPLEDDLVIIDKTTGIATRVGESGVGTSANGLAFDAAGVLYMVNIDGSYYTVNTSTGAATLVGSFGQMAHHGKFYPGTSLYYGIDQSFFGNNPRSIFVGDVTTGGAVDLLPTVDDLHTLAFVEESAPVPEPGTMLLLGSGLLGLAARRRRSA